MEPVELSFLSCHSFRNTESRTVCPNTNNELVSATSHILIFLFHVMLFAAFAFILNCLAVCYILARKF